MAIEGTETVVEQPGGDSTTTESQKPNVDNQDGKKPDGAPGTPPDKTGEYEKRIAGITSDLQKERKARQQYEADLKAARAEVDTERKRIQALVGVNPKSDQEVEETAIKARLEALGYPALTKEDLEAIRGFRATQNSLQETTQLYWQRNNQQVVEGLRETLEKELGGTLTDRQISRVVAEYVREAESNPEFLARHEKGDRTLIAEFAKQLTEDWFEPARRKVTQQETQRYRPVPDSKGRGIVTQGEKKIDVTDNKAVEDFLVKSYREKNGEFSGRR